MPFLLIFVKRNSPFALITLATSKGVAIGYYTFFVLKFFFLRTLMDFAAARSMFLG